MNAIKQALQRRHQRRLAQLTVMSPQELRTYWTTVTVVIVIGAIFMVTSMESLLFTILGLLLMFLAGITAHLARFADYRVQTAQLARQHLEANQERQ